MPEREDQRFGEWRGRSRGVLGGFVDEGDNFAVLLPVGVPGLRVFVVPLLLNEGASVCGEVDEKDAMNFGRVASATRVEAFELVGAGWGNEDRNQQGDDCDRCAVHAHGGMLSKEGRRDNCKFWQVWLR